MTPFRRAVLLVLLPVAATFGVFACRQEKPRPAAAAGRTRGLLAAHYQPPPDGLLTDRHLDLYGKVRRAARDRSEADAARALGVDPDEFAWVRARIVEALVALDGSRVREESGETYARAIASLRETLKFLAQSKKSLLSRPTHSNYSFASSTTCALGTRSLLSCKSLSQRQ